MLKKAAIIFGMVLIAIGILGFLPYITMKEMLLGVFYLNQEANILHLVSGGIAMVAGLINAKAAQIYFRVFSVIYALLAGIGFISVTDFCLA